MNVTVNTKRMRIMIGILGILLPWLVALITWSLPQSISITYYSVCAVGTFMVVLGSAGILLVNYKGYEKIDDIMATIAGIAGICVCLFPMVYDPDPSLRVGMFNLPSNISHIIHCGTAFVFFGILSFMSFFLFTKTSGEITKQKKIKNIIYRVCGIGMIGSFSLFLLNLIPGVDIPFLTWLVEAIALFFFGTSWIVKSDAFPFLQDSKKDAESSMSPIEAYHKIDNTICLNNIRKNIEFNIDKDEHIDCKDLDEAFDCLEIIKTKIEK